MTKKQKQFNLVQPCADCGMHTLPRNKKGHPLRGKCEYYLTERWDEAVKDGARFLCIGCLEKRLGRKLKWQDLVIPGDMLGTRIIDGPDRYFWDVSEFDSPRLAERKRGPNSRDRKKLKVATMTLEDLMAKPEKRRPLKPGEVNLGPLGIARVSLEDDPFFPVARTVELSFRHTKYIMAGDFDNLDDATEFANWARRYLGDELKKAAIRKKVD